MSADVSRPVARRRARPWLLLVLLPVVVGCAVMQLIAYDQESAAIGAFDRSERVAVTLELGTAAFAFTAFPVSGVLRIAGRKRGALALALVALLCVVILSLRSDRREAAMARMPHVLLISLDGFNAERMALYGSTRVTTPFLDALAARSLVALNSFPQSCCTAPSLVSLLTGRRPLDTNIFYPPHQLATRDQYRNLATLLRGRGYRTLQYAEEQYSDANQLLLRGFDRVNGWQRWVDASEPTWLAPHRWAVHHVLHNLRLSDSAEIELGPPMPGPRAAVEKFGELLQELRFANGPVFAQVHLLESHGPTFPVRWQKFSKGQSQTEEWMPDFYDDMLTNLDEELARFFSGVADLGLSDRVIVVITSDHGAKWKATERVPLLFFGPGVAPKQLLTNTEAIDVAPTVLRLLGMRQPRWMGGRSLHDRAPEAWRSIISVSISGHRPDPETGRWEIKPMTLNRGLSQLDAIVCDQRFSLDMRTGELRSSKLAGRFAPCPKGAVPSSDKMLHRLVEYLHEFGYAPLSPPFVSNVN